MVSPLSTPRYYLDLHEGEEGSTDKDSTSSLEDREGLEDGTESWAKSSSVKSRFDSKHLAKACQVIRALRNPKKKLLRPVFANDEDRILTYELTVSILKYASFLNQALDASEFYKRNPNYKKENNEDVLVVLYDLFERDFQVHRDDPILSRRFALLQQAVLGVRTKIMAHLARLRIQHQATTVNHLLPENLRHQKHIDQNPIYAWVNLKKAKLPFVLASLHENGFQRSDIEDDILIQEESFYVDVCHNDLIRFHSSRKDTIFNSTLVRDGLLVVQDKSACISVYTMVKSLFFRENLNRDRKLTSANLFANLPAPDPNSTTIYGSYLGIPLSRPPPEEWYENILETNKKDSAKKKNTELCVIVTHGGSGRSVAHLACLLQESVPRWLSRNTEMSARDDLATAINNKFIPRPPLSVVAFGVPANRQDEIFRFTRKQMQLSNVRFFSDDFNHVSPRDPRVKNACAILVNPPSSGSALKDPVSYICTEGGDEDVLVHLSKFVHTQTSPDAAQKYTSSQSKFLKHALNFSQAKLVLYTTCSLLHVENSDVVNTVVKEFDKEFLEYKTKIFNEIIYEKKPIRLYKEISLELVPLHQVLDTYAKVNFNGPFMEMPPSSASSGCFMALIRRKEAIVSIDKNPPRSLGSNASTHSSGSPGVEFAASREMSMAVMAAGISGETNLSKSIALLSNSSSVYPPGFVGSFSNSGSATNSTRSSRSTPPDGPRTRKRSMTKKAIIQRVSTPTHASLAKQTRKWTADTTKSSSRGGLQRCNAHSHTDDEGHHRVCVCPVCARRRNSMHVHRSSF